MNKWNRWGKRRRVTRSEARFEGTTQTATATPGDNAENPPADTDTTVPSDGKRKVPFKPDIEVPFPFAERTRKLHWIEILSLTGFRAHTSYWEERDEAEYSAFDDVIPFIFEDSISEVLK